MRFEKLDLNLLAVLDALLDEQSVTLGAKRLNLSQPAMSNAVRRLREYLDDPLLVRSGGGTVLTPRGEELRHAVRNILDQIRAELVVQPGFDAAVSDRTFTLMASDYTIHILLIPLIASMSRIAPNIRLNVRPLGGDPRDDFSRGETDLLIAPSQIVSPDHPGQEIFSDDYVVAAWADNPLIGDTLSADDYFSLGHITATFGPTGNNAFDEWMNGSTPRRRRIEIAVPSFRDVPDLLVGSNRVATLHHRYARKFMQTLPLRVYPIPFDCPSLSQIAQWHRLRANDRGIRWLVDTITETARSLAVPPALT